MALVFAVGSSVLLREAAFACSPEFPVCLLFDEEELFALPGLSFREGIAGLNFPSAVYPWIGPRPRTADPEEIAAALDKIAVIPAVREALLDWVVQFRAQFEGSFRGSIPRVARESLPQRLRQVPNGLPAQYRIYFEGALHYYAGEIDEARDRWIALLSLDEGERRERSTWAEYMLARTALDPAEAVQRFQAVRDLVNLGFADRLGLAYMSLGGEARVEMNARRNFGRAIRLYAEQHGAYPTRETIDSLQEAAARALRDDQSPTPDLVTDPFVRRILSLHVLDATGRGSADESRRRQGGVWQRFVEKSVESDPDLADRLAWAAYRGGDFAAATRYVSRADPDSSLTLWVASKLAARAGDLERARALLERVDPDAIRGAFTSTVGPRIGDRLAEEIGTLEVSMGRFEEALDSFGRGWVWNSAAYVAERVLTFEELERYVANLGPAPPPLQNQNEHLLRRIYSWNVQDERPGVEWRRLLRDLAARRSLRVGKRTQAKALSANGWKMGRVVELLDRSENLELPLSARAEALFSAACDVRDGLELLGTELAPDNAIYDGGFGGMSAEATMARRTAFKVVRPTADEIERERAHRAVPDKRYHYRYVAAELARKAARMFGRREPELRAEYLFAAGSWLKNRDAEAADQYYKELVRTCRGTALADEADRLRWFPKRETICPRRSW